jgi:hypothetical protein
MSVQSFGAPLCLKPGLHKGEYQRASSLTHPQQSLEEKGLKTLNVYISAPRRARANLTADSDSP